MANCEIKLAASRERKKVIDIPSVYSTNFILIIHISRLDRQRCGG